MSIPGIPKLFFQTSKKPLEPYLIKMTKKMLGSDWKYLHFLDSDILYFLETNSRKEFPGAIDIFKRLKRGEHKADFFRYYFLYIKIINDNKLRLHLFINKFRGSIKLFMPN